VSRKDLLVSEQRGFYETQRRGRWRPNKIEKTGTTKHKLGPMVTVMIFKLTENAHENLVYYRPDRSYQSGPLIE